MSHPRHHPRGIASGRDENRVKLRLRLPTDGSVDLDQLRAALEARLQRGAEPVVAEPGPVIGEPVVVEPVVVEPEPVEEPPASHGWKFVTMVLFAGIALAVVMSGTGVGLVAYGHTGIGLILGAVGLLLLGVGIALWVRQRREVAPAEVEVETEPVEEWPAAEPAEPISLWERIFGEPYQEETGLGLAVAWVKTNPKKTAGLGVATFAVFGMLVLAVAQGLTPGKSVEIAKEKPPTTGIQPPMPEVADDPMPASLKALAEQGDVDAQYEWAARLAARAQAGALDSRAPTMARMFEQSGGNGHPVAMYNAGVVNLLGDGVPVNVARADQWFRRAVGEGRFPAAGSLIPTLYENQAKALIDQANPEAKEESEQERRARKLGVLTDDPSTPDNLTTNQSLSTPTPTPVATEPEESSQPEKGLMSRLGLVAIGLAALLGLLATGRGKPKGPPVVENQIHFWPGLRHFIAAQGAHVLMAGTIGMVWMVFGIQSIAYDYWFWAGLVGLVGLVGLPLSTIVVLLAGLLGVDLMPTFDRKNIRQGGKPVWRFIRRKRHLIFTMAVFVGSLVTIMGYLPFAGWFPYWLKYSLTLGLAGAFLFKGGRLATCVENVKPLPGGRKNGIEFGSIIRANTPQLGMLSLGAAIVLVAATGWGMNDLWWLTASAALILSAVAWLGFVYPRVIRHWMNIVMLSAVIAMIFSWFGASFWWVFGGLVGVAIFGVNRFILEHRKISGRMLVFPEVNRPARPLVQISDEGDTQVNWGGLGAVAVSGLAMLISAGIFIWGNPQKLPPDNQEFARQPNGTDVTPPKPGPKKPAIGGMVIPEIARQMQAKAQEWKNRAATGPQSPTLPAVLEKLSAGYLVPKKAVLMAANQRQVTAAGSELTAQLTLLTGQGAHTERIDLHPSGRWLVETKKDGVLLVWDMAPPQAAGSVLLLQVVYVNADIAYLNRRPTLRRFNIDGTAFLITLGEKRFARGIFANGKLSLLKETALDYPPKWFSPSRRFVARISRINGVHVEVQDLRGEIPATLIQTPGQTTLNFAFSPDDIHAAVATSDGTKGQVIWWNWREKRALHLFTSSDRGYHAIHFSPDGRRLFAVTNAREIMAWNVVQPAQPLYRVPLGTKSAVQLRTDPTGKWLLAHWSTNPSGVGDPQNWQVINAQNGAVTYAEFQPSTPLSFSTNGKWIASKGASGLPSVYDLEQKKPVSPPALKAKVGQFHFARGNTLFVIRTIDGRAHLLNFE